MRSRHHLLMSARQSDIPNSLPPLPWHVHQSKKRFADANGAPITYCGVSAFRALDRWFRGEDVFQWLRAEFPLANVLRVWPYVPWAVNGWDAPPVGVAIDFIRAAEVAGFVVELTLLTDNNPRRIGWANAYLDTLASVRLPNLLVELGNEPDFEKNDIAVNRLYVTANGSGYLWSSGLYMEGAQLNNLLRGTYGTAHTPRTVDFARRGHDLREYWNGDGPDVPHIPMNVPWVGDEQIRPDLVDPQPVGTIEQSFRAHGACCAMLGAGATFHYGGADGSTGGKQTVPPNPFEKRCADEFFLGLTTFKPSELLGPYDRLPLEPGGHPDSRSYIVGDCMVRCWPPTPTAPPGWRALDSEGILCRRA